MSKKQHITKTPTTRVSNTILTTCISPHHERKCNKKNRY